MCAHIRHLQSGASARERAQAHQTFCTSAVVAAAVVGSRSVATQDVGRIAAKLTQEDRTGTRIVELQGPRRVSPNDLAAAFAKILRTPVRAETVPRETWEGLFRSQGMRYPGPRIRMLDGFNEGWIDFSGGSAKALKGTVSVEDVVASFVQFKQPWCAARCKAL